MTPAPQTIHAEKLCALTGLTDRRHRQLAKEGYFPPPVRGEYQLTATIAGLFKYYRAKGDNGTKDKIAKEDLRKSKRENDEAEGKLQKVAYLVEWLTPILNEARTIAENKFCKELVPATHGKTPEEILTAGKLMFDEFMAALLPLAEKFALRKAAISAAEAPPTPPQA